MTVNSWIPPLPDGWQKTTLRRMGRIFAGGTPDRKNESFWSDGDIPWLNSGAINQGTITHPTTFITEQATMNGATRWVAPKSVLVALAGQGKTKGTSARTEIGSTFNQSLAAIEPNNNLDYRYLHYWIQSNYQNVRNLAGGDLRDGLNLDHIGSIELPLPPREVQRHIADYLDHETAEIDQLITGLDSLQVLSTERVEARIIKTIQTGGWSTEGLADTGLPEWPQAPISWRRTRLKSTIRDARNGAWGEDPDIGGEIRRCIRVADFSKSSASIHENAVTSRSYARPQVRDLSLEAGDLIIEKSGGGPTTPVGNVVLYSGPGGDMYSNFVARIRLADGIDATYAAWLHRSLYLNQVTHRSIKQTTGIQNLDADSYFNESIFVPPYEEQHRIGSSVAKMVESQDELRSEIRKSIDLARKRRAALITAAVTGQIDVTARNKPAAEQLEDDIAQGLHREN